MPWTSAKIQKMLREEYSQTTDAYDYHGKRYPVRTLIAKSLANQSLPMPEPHIDIMNIKKSVSNYIARSFLMICCTHPWIVDL